MKSTILMVLGIGAMALPATGAQVFVIDSSPVLFSPSFRDATNSDAGNTTWWGWSAGTFGTPSSALNNPAVTLGAGGLDGSVAQTTGQPLVSGSANLYAPPPGPHGIQFTIPTAGVVGTGFTTIIVQGRTAFGGFDNNNPGIFGDIAGVSPTVVVGNNSAASGQFWVKYEISGNAASYTMDYALANFTSIANLTVDTQWSATGFAPDIAVVPEPGTLLLAGIGLLALWFVRRRLSPRFAR